jgi:para-nitrobenzyl esterase
MRLGLASVLVCFAVACSDDEVATTGSGTGGRGTTSVASTSAHATAASTTASSSSTGGMPGCEAAPATDPFTVQTSTGTIRGEADGGVTAYRGIPFAEPPVGELRFKAPEPHACWTDVRDAVEYGSACAQILPSQSQAGSEDCLFLNVWAPTTPGPHAVLYFVHGGAYLLGSGSQDLVFEGTGNLYDGKTLAAERDVVVVSVNYRLGELGFLAHPALSSEDPHGSSGNYGLLDQIAGLQWVHDNIARFGGDPAEVMLFGESAGGLSTCLLLSSPLAKGLFSRALIESGGCIVGSKASRQDQGVAIAKAVGCEGAADVPACLRSKPASAYLASAPDGFSPFVFEDTQRAWEMLYGPNQDGYVFVEPPMQSIRTGHGSVVPLTIGTNANEFDLFVPPGTINTCASYWTLMESMFPDHAAEIITMYDCFAYVSPRFAATAVGTDFMFTCPARRIARAALQGGAPSVHRYHERQIYSNSPLTALRAFHASELPFVFRTFGVMGYQPTTGDTAVSKAMAGYWTGFAATGTPSAMGLPSWPAYDPVNEAVLVFDDGVDTDAQVASTKCDFWDGIAAE